VSLTAHQGPASVTIVTIHYRARCTEPACKNVARMILRHAEAGGAPLTSLEFCNAHGRARLETDRTAGLKVYDDRKLP
jgi:hypothetical protein